MPSPYETISRSRPVTWICPPCIDATKSATLSSDSLTNAWSFPTAATPTTLFCQRSFSATSAIETLNFAFTRSMAERRRCRFDLSEPGSGRMQREAEHAHEHAFIWGR